MRNWDVFVVWVVLYRLLKLSDSLLIFPLLLICPSYVEVGILCGLCVRITEQAGERLGMSFTKRGFVTRANVPFGGQVAEGLSREVAARCVQACRRE